MSECLQFLYPARRGVTGGSLKCFSSSTDTFSSTRATAVLAYFAAPGFITMNDLAIDCALTPRRLVYDGLNPILRERGREELHMRIGMDSGTVAVLPVGSPSTKQQRDLLGEVVSLACKIQGLAARGGIALGDVTLRNLHHQWRGICTELPLPEETYPAPRLASRTGPGRFPLSCLSDNLSLAAFLASASGGRYALLDDRWTLLAGERRRRA